VTDRSKAPVWSGHSCPLLLTLTLTLTRHGCPMSRALCETWDSTTASICRFRSAKTAKAHNFNS